MENNYQKSLTEKLNQFSGNSFCFYLTIFFILISILSIYIRVFLLKFTVFNFLNLGIGIFCAFLVVLKIKIKENTHLSNKSILFILIYILTYNTVFGMIGFPVLPFIPVYFLKNMLVYTLISYVGFIYFYIRDSKNTSKIFFKIFILLSVIDLFLPFILLIIRGE
ncbi:hypothetical protein [Fusobacterium gastrosuis]|uniref:hypothetical protein n=1 Tax=Fusobacterium gastrosuis TaxID=1755100 RepID=UPI002973F7C7|nr:hypothetical protein [Fusobacteriaceae bacterium]MDY5714297.1 hypothetical protein [Fusobacterium gastrosuis]